MCVQRRKDGSMALLLYANLFFFPGVRSVGFCSLFFFFVRRSAPVLRVKTWVLSCRTQNMHTNHRRRRNRVNKFKKKKGLTDDHVGSRSFHLHTTLSPFFTISFLFLLFF